jgi:hypothetical protein
MYRYITNLDIPRKWFQSNIDHIMKIYGKDRRLTREDIFLGSPRTKMLSAIAHIHVLLYQLSGRWTPLTMRLLLATATRMGR